MRRMSGSTAASQPLRDATATSDNVDAAKTPSATSSRPERREAGAFQHDAPQRDQEIARRHDVGDGLQRTPACWRSER